MESAEAPPVQRADGKGCGFLSEARGDWNHGPELMADLVAGRVRLSDPVLQNEMRDWMNFDDKIEFRNKETGESVFALAAKRGNRAYAAKKGQKLNELLKCVEKCELDRLAPGRRSNYRFTRVLFFTFTFSHERYTPEQAWAALRTTSPEGMDFECNVLNRFGANISKIFGPNGKLTCKESDSSGYPAPHMIVILDRPVLVYRHNDRNGGTSWRIADPRVLARLGKDSASRARSFVDTEVSSSENPVWKHGMFDVQGVVKGSKFGRFSSSFTYVFKYLLKTTDAERYEELREDRPVSEIKDKSVRTMFYTHLGNKCFRTRDISFGKAFKTRVGMLPKEQKTGSSWEYMRTVPAFVADRIVEMRERKIIRSSELERRFLSPLSIVFFGSRQAVRMTAYHDLSQAEA